MDSNQYSYPDSKKKQPMEHSYNILEMEIDEYMCTDSIKIEKLIQENVHYENYHRMMPMCDDRYVFKEVVIHLDFKGAPPKFDFLINLIRFFAS